MSLSSEEEDQFLSDGQSVESGEDDSNADDDDDDDDDDDEPFMHPPQMHTFGPPYYGRPPTPLPPSPSLTSLLRPSRPTTPDASDDDFEPVPRASPKVPTYEYYGFVLYLFSSMTFLIYLLWSYLPSPFLHALGIYYYPNRWWSLAIPSFLVMLIVYIYAALAAFNTEMLTYPMSSVETVVDDAAHIAVIDSRGRIRYDPRRGKARERGHGGGGGGGAGGARERGLVWKNIWNEGTDAVMDVPLAGVCEILYGGARAGDEEFDVD